MTQDSDPSTCDNIDEHICMMHQSCSVDLTDPHIRRLMQIRPKKRVLLTTYRCECDDGPIHGRQVQRKSRLIRCIADPCMYVCIRQIHIQT
jgi:hypothetical protein